MPKFSHTAEVGTLHTPDGCKPRKVIVIEVAVMTSCTILVYSSAMQHWLVLLGINVVQVVGSNPARAIVIKLVVHKKILPLLSRFFTHVDTCI
jgi:hypothetical protein